MMIASDESGCLRCEAEVPIENQALHELQCLGETQRCEAAFNDGMNCGSTRTMVAREHQSNDPSNLDAESSQALPEMGPMHIDASAVAAAHATVETAGQTPPSVSPEAASIQVDTFVVEVAPRNGNIIEETPAFAGHQNETELQEHAHTSSAPRIAPSNNESWTCAACTFDNTSGGIRCEVCQSYRASPGPASWLTGQRLTSEGGAARVLVVGQPCKGFCSFISGALIGVILCSYAGLGKDLGANGALVMKLVVGLIGGCMGYRVAVHRRALQINSRPLLAAEDVAEQGQSSLQMTMATPVLSSRMRVEELDAILASRMRRLHHRHSRTSLQSDGIRSDADTERATQLEARLDALLHLVAEHQQRRAGEQQMSAAPRGIIASLPTHTLSADQATAMPAEHRSCTICIEDFQEGDEIRMLPCFHRFHKRCVDRWLRRSGNCPICKHRVDGAD